VLIPKDSCLINLTAKVHTHGLLDMGQDNHLCCHNEIGEFFTKLKEFFFFFENVECNLNLNCLRVMLTSVRHSLTIHFRKILKLFLWKMKKAVKTLIIFFFPIKTLFN